MSSLKIKLGKEVNHQFKSYQENGGREKKSTDIFLHGILYSAHTLHIPKLEQ